ncbi:hypothetical protein ACWDSJ_26160 [Nocardia sp. NPDC003482]
MTRRKRAPWWELPRRHRQLLRLLQDTYAEIKDLHYGPPRTTVPRQSQEWRETVERLLDRANDLKDHAVARGIPHDWISAAIRDSREGMRYTNFHPHPHEGAVDEKRVVIIDTVEAEVWRLEKMAALVALRRERLDGAGILTEPDPATATRIDHVMGQVWARLAMQADAADLTEEREQLWGTDVGRWQRVLAVVARADSDDELFTRWRTCADYKVSGVRSRRAQSAEVTTPGPLPPRPEEMIAAAERALTLPPGIDHPGKTGAETGLDIDDCGGTWTTPAAGLHGTGVEPSDSDRGVGL